MNSVFILFSLFVLVFVIVYVFVLHKNPDFFLIDDSYYLTGKAFFEGKVSLLHQYRGPGLSVLYSAFNVFPDFTHPYIRLIVGLIVTYANLFFAAKILSNILNKHQLFWGLLLSVFNPLYVHFTLKNTPETYSVLIIGIIIYSYMRSDSSSKTKYLLYSLIAVLAGMSFKPVFFLIPLMLSLHYFVIKKRRKLVFAFLILNLISVMSYYSFQKFTKLEDESMFSYGFTDILARVYLFDAMMKTGELNLGTTDELINTGPIKSNFLLCNEYFQNWLIEYKKDNPVIKESKVAVDFTKDNLFRSVALRLASPVLFISLTSNTNETIIYLFLYGFLSFVSFLSLKKVYKPYKNEMQIIVCVIFGYAVVFFLTLSYARYSIPLMFYLLPFIGINIDTYINKFLERTSPINNTISII